jgi:hypothetical protein
MPGKSVGMKSVNASKLLDQITAYQNQALAAALCIWTLVPTLALYLLLEGVGGRRRFAINDNAGSSELILPRGWRIGLATLAIFFIGLVAVVYITMLAGAFVHDHGNLVFYGREDYKYAFYSMPLDEGSFIIGDRNELASPGTGGGESPGRNARLRDRLDPTLSHN